MTQISKTTLSDSIDTMCDQKLVQSVCSFTRVTSMNITSAWICFSMFGLCCVFFLTESFTAIQRITLSTFFFLFPTWAYLKEKTTKMQYCNTANDYEGQFGSDVLWCWGRLVHFLLQSIPYTSWHVMFHLLFLNAIFYPFHSWKEQ